MDLSVVIPVKDEADSIAALTDEICGALDGLAKYEIIYVDDGSGDATLGEILRVRDRIPQVRFLRHAENFGQSAAIRTGVRAARGLWIATLDGDGQNDPADLPGFWRIAQGAPVDQPLLITGQRENRRDNWSKCRASCIANAIRRWFLADNTPDTGCGLKLFPRSLFLDLPFFNHMHRFLPALVLREGGVVRSLPVNHRPRLGGRSKYGTIDRLLVGVVDLFGVMWLQRRAARPRLLSEAVPDVDATASHQLSASAAPLPP
ncbi:MAG: glycosyltransferase family 2 protein [Alphaproteobacteria bacterium]|nr:glycosyltransferase family 2 protein [Alphaproteobacteria bacterium]